MNLIEELGRQYIAERFDQCMFYGPERRPCVLRAASRWNPEDGVPVQVINGTPSNKSVEDMTLDADFFKDLNTLAVPQLGWRSTAEGKYMLYYSRNNASYHRGLAPKNLQRYMSPVTRYLLETDNLDDTTYANYHTDVLMIMKPEFQTLADGVERLRAGELISFCVSPVLAVMPAKGSNMSVYFNTRPVATIDKDNNILCENKIIGEYLRTHL